MAEKHFYEQKKYTEDYLIPFLDKHLKILHKPELKILEVCCAEGGTIASFKERDYDIDGIEYEAGRVAIAKQKIKNNSSISVGDITNKADLNFEKKYDLIIIRDVIEHVDGQQIAMDHLYDLLDDHGHVFITFPLKYSPYAGHQQTARNFLKYILFISLLPKFVIKILCKIAHDEPRIENLYYLKSHALSFYKFNKMIKSKWRIFHGDFFLSRPVFKQRFGWPIIKLPKIPIIKEFSAGCELILSKK